MEELFRQRINERIDDLNKQLAILNSLQYKEEDIKYFVEWYDDHYDLVAKNANITNTLDEAVDWLFNESHPMSFRGVSKSIYSYIVIGDEKLILKYYNVKELIDAKKKEKAQKDKLIQEKAERKQYEKLKNKFEN